MLLEPTSLVNTIDNINQKLLDGDPITRQEEIEAARWIIAQEGKKGSYRGMFAPTQSDFDRGIRAFTGEKLESASGRHIMGQEAARVAWLFGAEDETIQKAYHRATTWMHDLPEFQHTGTFCCGKCTLAFWRHYWIGDFENKEAYFSMGLQAMKTRRIGGGKWQRFPFFYAIYTLSGIDLESALAELRYAAPVMERYVKTARSGVYYNRKVAICNQALEKIN